jgi:hypothetical protein
MKTNVLTLEELSAKRAKHRAALSDYQDMLARVAAGQIQVRKLRAKFIELGGQRHPADTDAAPRLSSIKLDEQRSRETPFFTAELGFEGAVYAVSNEGRGGANNYFPMLSQEAEARLNQWAAETLPAIEMQGIPPMPMDFETWTFNRAYSSAR